MSQLALVSVVAGAVIIAVRGPFVLAPAASSAGGRWLIASSARIRVAGVLFAALGLAMISLCPRLRPGGGLGHLDPRLALGRWRPSSCC